MEIDSDERIIEKIRGGDISLYKKIIERFEDKLGRYINQMIYSRADKEDVLQEVFIKTFKNLNSYNSDLKFSSWIYRIAHNETINWIKKNQKNKMVEIIDNDVDINSQEKSAYEKMSHIKDIKKIQKCIGKIPIKYKEAILLRYIEEKTYEEISDILRKPTSSIGTLIQRGIKELQKTCQNQK